MLGGIILQPVVSGGINSWGNVQTETPIHLLNHPRHQDVVLLPAKCLKIRYSQQVALQLEGSQLQRPKPFELRTDAVMCGAMVGNQLRS